MIPLFWYFDTTVGATLTLYGLLALEILALIGLGFLYFRWRRGLFKFFLTLFVLINVAVWIGYMSTIAKYREFRNQYEFYSERSTDVSGNLDFYLQSPIKFPSILAHVTEGWVDSVDTLLRCVIEAKNAACIPILDEVVHFAAMRVAESAPEGYIVPLKYQEVQTYLTKLYETGIPAQQFYAARLLRNNYETDISFSRLPELRALVPSDVPLPVQ